MAKRTPDGYLEYPENFATTAIHAFQDPEQWESMAVVTPIVLATTYKQYSPGHYKKYDYARSGNPTREVLEKCLATLETAKFGLVFPSGLGAVTALISLFKNGDHLISGDDIYGGTNRLFNQIATRFGIEFTFVDTRNPDNISQAIRKNTKLIWLETPTNPTMKVTDIETVSKIAKKNNLLLAIDNTFLTPYLQRPFNYGADIVMHSITKYINGHSDVLMGALITNNPDLYERLKFLQNAMGIVPSPFDCSQVIRSLKTLPLRMEKHRANSLAIARFLESHPKIERVLHPSLPSHPQNDLFKKQTSGHSGIFSFYLRGGLGESQKFLGALKIFTLAGSLGGHESLIALPIIMTHEAVPEDLQKKLGITNNLIRISVGLEDVADLIQDLEQALEKI